MMLTTLAIPRMMCDSLMYKLTMTSNMAFEVGVDQAFSHGYQISDFAVSS